MLPTFGCGLRRFLMEPNTAATRAAIAAGHHRRRWPCGSRGSGSPSVGVTPGEDPSLVWIDIAYVRLADLRPDNLVYPFYLGDGGTAMALIGPVLDDRTYEQLRDELVRRIPVYAPEWTDHNASDPGIALLELFAYLGESLLYRFNQIPDATKVAFLRCSASSRGRRRPPARCWRLETERPDGRPGAARHARRRPGAVPFETDDEVYVWPLDAVGAGKIARRADRRRPREARRARRRRTRRPAPAGVAGRTTPTQFYADHAGAGRPDAPDADRRRRQRRRSTGRCGSRCWRRADHRRRARWRADRLPRRRRRRDGRPAASTWTTPRRRRRRGAAGRRPDRRPAGRCCGSCGTAPTPTGRPLRCRSTCSATPPAA